MSRRRTSSALAAISDRKPARAIEAGPAAELRSRTIEALGDLGLSVTVMETAADEVGALATDAESIAGRMVAAGRRLRRLQETVGPGGYKALREARLVPFGEAMASKLRAVAEAVDDGRIPEPSMPRALTAAYAAARLPAPEAARLLETGVVRPEATEREVRDALPAKATTDEDASLSKTERGRLERQRDRLLARLREIEARLAAR